MVVAFAADMTSRVNGNPCGVIGKSSWGLTKMPSISFPNRREGLPPVVHLYPGVGKEGARALAQASMDWTVSTGSIAAWLCDLEGVMSPF